jgi:hypothetical protein
MALDLRISGSLEPTESWPSSYACFLVAQTVVGLNCRYFMLT